MAGHDDLVENLALLLRTHLGVALAPAGRFSDMAVPPLIAALVTILVTFLLRVLAIIYNWRTGPIRESGLFPFRHHPPVA